MRDGKSILVVGAGVVGLCTAYYAARRGHRVTVVERGGEGCDCCSVGNAGLVVPSHVVPLAAPGMIRTGLRMMLNPESPFYVRPRIDRGLFDWAWKFYRAANAANVARAAPLLRDLHLASRACFEELTDLPGGTDFGFVNRGLLVLCKTEHALEEEAKAAELARQLGLPAEVLDARETAAREPGVRMDVAGAVYFPSDCHLSPSQFLDAMRAHLHRLGVTFLWDTEVTGWRVRGNTVEAALTPGGEIPADEFVLCGGSWTPAVARDLGLRLPMQAGKGYSLTLPRPRQLLQAPAILSEARVAVTPMGTSLRFAGTMEIAGMNGGINPARVRGIVRSVPSYYPEFTPADFEGVTPWSGLRPCSPDGLPYVGRTNRYANLAVATGHAMMGLSLGPVTGKLIAEVLSGEPPSLDIDLLHPDRYTGRRKRMTPSNGAPSHA